MNDSEMPSLEHEDKIVPLPVGQDENDSSDEESWDEVNDEDSNSSVVPCLFCEEEFKNVQPQALEHLRVKHSVDLAELKTRLNMDEYSFIKMVNYIRFNKTPASVLASTKEILWSDDQHMKPIVIDDWLMFDYDILEMSTKLKPVAKSEQQQIEELLVLLKQKDSMLEDAASDIEKLKSKFREMFEHSNENGNSSSAINEPVERSCVSSVPVDQDEGYFNTYAHYGIHHEMLSDAVRTDSYRDAIISNAATFAGKVVLDLGCGTSILSMFASKSGAKQVIAVDQSDIIYQAMDIARNNNFKNITFVKGRLENTEIPVNKVDIIVSEWMGYFLLFEGMLDSVIYARDHHLVPGGILLPNRCNISIVGLDDQSRHTGLIRFWDDVYGFDMSGLRAEVLSEASVEICPAECIITEPQVVSDLNLMTVDVRCCNFVSDFRLRVLRHGKLTAIVGYFDTFFELPNAVAFSTGPAVKPTHWKQTVFYLPEAVAVRKGDYLEGKFTCSRDRKDLRALVIYIELFGRKMKYHLN